MPAVRWLTAIAALLVGVEALRHSPSSRSPHSSSGKTKKKKQSSANDQPEVIDPNSTCPRVAYIRIQKTGSSTLGECILPTMCLRHNQTAFSETHLEYRRAKHRAKDCMLTMLRDPVERFFSEFNFIRGHENLDPALPEQDQWDFDIDDIEWLRQVRNMADSGAALKRYLHYPNNPSRNRQALYVLGFQRVPCMWDRCCGEQCTKPEFTAGFPAREYNWDLDHDKLLARAKRHLLSMRAFGVADCYKESVGVIAKAFGWNATDVELIARGVHLRQTKKWDAMLNFSGSSGGANLAAPMFLLSRHQTQIARRGSAAAEEGEQVDANSVLWRSFVREDLAEEIRRVNRLDDELVAFAKRQLYERHGIRCGRNFGEVVDT